MAQPLVDLDLNIEPQMPRRKDFRIGCIGSGFIMRDVHLVAYQAAGFTPIAVASRTPQHAREAAALRGVPRVHDRWQQLLADKDVEIVDIAFPPDQQVEIIREACHQPHIKGILAQKPLAMNYRSAREAVETCKKAGIKLAVNSNMRYDQSMRALKTILDRGYLGQPVVATIDMRAIPHWQSFLEAYDRLTLLNMSIHHIDVFRYLFGDPDRVLCSIRTDPRTKFHHTDGIPAYIFEYASGLRTMSLDDVWAWPGEGTEKDIYIRWRVEGTEGMARGTIGWPFYPVPTPSTIDFTTRKSPGAWYLPRWNKVWFPDAFAGTMAQLLRAVEENSVPEIDAEDNLKTMAAVDACYRSSAEGRAVALREVMN
ncbi:MAG TPA: Gfo/Idh/MocA family oxidoreductase [Spirochaetia bacterium]|nr:Gfo/Idh/MocA family oxidoreductase [Spirochaetia bacterium]